MLRTKSNAKRFRLVLIASTKVRNFLMSALLFDSDFNFLYTIFYMFKDPTLYIHKYV